MSSTSYPRGRARIRTSGRGGDRGFQRNLPEHPTSHNVIVVVRPALAMALQFGFAAVGYVGSPAALIGQRPYRTEEEIKASVEKRLLADVS